MLTRALVRDWQLPGLPNPAAAGVKTQQPRAREQIAVLHRDPRRAVRGQVRRVDDAPTLAVAPSAPAIGIQRI
jgi:hypothetical protein